ncbi:MAG: putative selenate reductase subunit YgfK [Synergistaceae bacterium]|nr:putative selenate reductase subunit YgfK [Synergistaceae bacterium]
MKPQPLSKLITWAFREYEVRGSIFGISASAFRNHSEDAPYSSHLFGERLAAPIGPAAGPGTQLAQNIISGWLSGARFIELKTVQIMDELEIVRPCIDMEDEGYNAEWSQELRLDESAREYVKAWIMLPILRRMLGWEDNSDGTIFNMSVGYNLGGILQPKMQKFLNTMTDAGELIAEYRDELSKNFPEFADVPVANKISGNCALSTMHGCPPDEIGRIAKYLLDDRGLHLSVKLNPTLMGPDFVRGTLRDALGYESVDIPDSAFENDLKYPQAVEIIRELKEISARRERYFGVKLSNTLAVRNNRGFMPGGEMYMSGRSLYPIAMNLWNRLSREFAGEINVSYSAGADADNTPTILMCGARTVTVASDILKPGGYARFPQYIDNISGTMRERGASNLGEFASDRRNVLESAAAASLTEKKYRKRYFRGVPKVKSPLGKFDCVEAPCMERCAVRQDIPSYVLAISRGDFGAALDIILSKNPLPGVTGRVCTRACESGCARNNYDEPVNIRALKRFTAGRGHACWERASRATGHKAVVIGAGPSGLAAAAVMARSGIAVTVYETRERAGGMMAIAPEFRLPKNVMDDDVERITSLGVKIKYGMRIAIPPENLLKDGFDAVYVACGFPNDTPLEIKSDGAEGVWTALDLLERVSKGERPALGSRVLVVGGGNTAVDVARTAGRLTGTSVTMVYRRTRKEMPSEWDEQELLLEEGNTIIELASPRRVVTRAGRVTGLECERTRLGPPDADGRRRSEPYGEFFSLDADSIIVAIGQSSDIAQFPGTKLKFGRKGEVLVNANGRTSLCGVYAGGDIATGPETVIRACAEGARAAEAICAELSVPVARESHRICPIGDELSSVKAARILRTAPEIGRRLPPEARGGFDPVEQTLDEASAIREAKRCLQCQTICRKCVEVCPNRANFHFEITPVAISLPTFAISDGRMFSDGHETFSVGQSEQIVHIEDFCNECGNCGVFCVHNGRPYEDKPRLILNEADFEASGVGDFLHVTQGLIRRRFGGREEKLSISSNGYLYEADGINVEMSRGLTVTSAEITGAQTDGPDKISLRSAMEMWVVYSGIARSLPWLLE